MIWLRISSDSLASKKPNGNSGLKPSKDKIMSTYDRLIEKGIGKGIEQGIEQGIGKGIEQNTIDVIKNCLKNDIKIPMIANITGLSESKVLEIIKSMDV